MKPEIPEVENGIHQTAVSLYGTDAMDDFPVLKAFQQYIDAEQARARKRLLTLGVFFGVLMLFVIAVFVVMLYGAGQRNQMLNDRLVEFAMKERDRERQAAAVVVQPPVQQDNTAILALTAKIDEMQKKLATSQKIAEDAEKARIAAVKAAEATKKASAEQVEIQRLKALLAAEKERVAAEAARRRQEELEAYRRRQYPELYAKPQPKVQSKVQTAAKKVVVKEEKVDEDVGLDDDDAIDYFKEESSPSGEKSYSIPVDVKGSKGKWLIPDE